MPADSETLDHFLETLASRSPTPGGGSASALVGAIGAALCGMVGRLNDKKSGEAGPLHETIETADGLRDRLRRLIDEDVEAFRQLMACWRLPEDDPDRREKNQAATIGATRTPIEIMATAYEVMRLASPGIDKSKKNCLSDAGVAAFLAHACLEGARMNVMINLPGIEDAAERDALKAQADRLRSDAARLAEDIARRLDARYH